jgi:hypothetical protein
MTENDTKPEPIKPDWAPSAPLEYHQVFGKLSVIIASKPEGYCYDRPDGISACQYWHSETGEPGCLVGQLLLAIGAPWEFLVACDKAGNNAAIDQLIKDGKLHGVFETRTGLALKHLQTQQDSGEPWSRCLEQMQSFWAGLRSLERHLEGLTTS